MKQISQCLYHPPLFPKNPIISLAPHNPRKNKANNLPKGLASNGTPQTSKRDGHYVAYAPEQNPIHLARLNNLCHYVAFISTLILLNSTYISERHQALTNTLLNLYMLHLVTVILPGSLPSSGHCSGPEASTLPYFMGILGPPAS